MCPPPSPFRLAPVDAHRYTFRSVWEVKASAADALAVLEDVETYPEWWPEIRDARPSGGDGWIVRCRSVLPYDLVFVMTEARNDPGAGILEAHMEGDLEGFSRWRVQTAPSGATLVFEEEVSLRKSSLRKLAPVARPAFKANHALMMRNGRRGLRTYLAGYRKGRATAGVRGL